MSNTTKSDRFAYARERHFGDRDVLCYSQRPSDLVSAMRRTVTLSGHLDAVVDEARRLSFTDLWTRSGDFARTLIDCGIEPSDRVALAINNRLEFVIALVAGLRIGAIVVPINVRESAKGFSWILGDCGACAIVVEQSLVHLLPDDQQMPALKTRIIVDETGFVDCAPDRSTVLMDHQADEEDPAILLYTSGTTGNPKGAILTHLNVIHTTIHYTDFWELGAQERAILAVPASHVTGIVAIIATNLVGGGCTIMMRRFDPEGFVNLAIAESLTWTILVPAMYNMILQNQALDAGQLRRWRVGGFGGAPMPAPSVAELARVLPHLELLNAYGSTECASVVTTVRPGQSVKSATTVGEAVTCCEIRVVDGGKDVTPGTPGELWLRGPNTVPGYWNNDKKTAESFVDGYWLSGDLGFVDDEGFVVVLDRIDDVINRGGYKVYGVEVENQLIAHPQVIEAAVIGRFDDVLGQAIVAIIHASSPKLDRDTVRDFCKEHLASYKTPDDVRFVDQALPRNANGKVLKRMLKNDLSNG